jgi:hypothetical protein
MHRRALGGYKKVLGLEHPYTLTSVSNLGSVLESQGKYEEAEAVHREVLGPEHPRTLSSISNLGLVSEGQGKYEPARAATAQPRTLNRPLTLNRLPTLNRPPISNRPRTLKEAASEPIPLGPVRASTARPRTSNRPASKRPRPPQRPSSSRRPSSNSTKPSSKSTKPSTSSSRPSSGQRPSSSFRRTGSAQGGRTRPKSSYQGQPTIYEDEDNDVAHGIIVLCTLIDLHAERFYAAQYSLYVRRTIGKALVNHIMVGGSKGTAPHILPH